MNQVIPHDRRRYEVTVIAWHCYGRHRHGSFNLMNHGVWEKSKQEESYQTDVVRNVTNKKEDKVTFLPRLRDDWLVSSLLPFISLTLISLKYSALAFVETDNKVTIDATIPRDKIILFFGLVSWKQIWDDDRIEIKNNNDFRRFFPSFGSAMEEMWDSTTYRTKFSIVKKGAVAHLVITHRRRTGHSRRNFTMSYGSAADLVTVWWWCILRRWENSDSVACPSTVVEDTVSRIVTC